MATPLYLSCHLGADFDSGWADSATRDPLQHLGSKAASFFIRVSQEPTKQGLGLFGVWPPLAQKTKPLSAIESVAVFNLEEEILSDFRVAPRFGRVPSFRSFCQTLPGTPLELLPFASLKT